MPIQGTSSSTIPDIPERFTDPVTKDLMSDPVVCNDGRTYERKVAEQLKESPFTRLPLRICAENVSLRGDLFEAYPAQQAIFRSRNPSAGLRVPSAGTVTEHVQRLEEIQRRVDAKRMRQATRNQTMQTALREINDKLAVKAALDYFPTGHVFAGAFTKYVPPYGGREPCIRLQGDAPRGERNRQALLCHLVDELEEALRLKHGLRDTDTSDSDAEADNHMDTDNN